MRNLEAVLWAGVCVVDVAALIVGARHGNLLLVLVAAVGIPASIALIRSCRAR